MLQEREASETKDVIVDIEDVTWSVDLKWLNSMALQSVKEFKWDGYFKTICEVLEHIDIKYFHPEDFFNTLMTVTYWPYSTLDSNDLPGSQFPFDTTHNVALFHKLYQYWILFFSHSLCFIPPHLFGYFWTFLAFRQSLENPQEDEVCRTLCQKAIQASAARADTKRDDCHLYESGHEYTAITGTLSAILRAYVLQDDSCGYTIRDVTFLEFFAEMMCLPPFSWKSFFRIRENADRFLFLVENLIWYTSCTHPPAQEYVGKTVGEFSIALEHLEMLCRTNVDSFKPPLALRLFYVLTRIWKQLQKDRVPCLPNLASIFQNLDARANQMKPTINNFTVFLCSDPVSRHEYSLILFAQFEGFPPRFWYPCSKKEIRALTPQTLCVDEAITYFLRENHVYLSLKEYSPCKLRGKTRLADILKDFQKRDPPFAMEYTVYDDIPTPWFSHEKIIFQKIRQKARFRLESRILPLSPPKNITLYDEVPDLTLAPAITLSDLESELFNV